MTSLLLLYVLGCDRILGGGAPNAEPTTPTTSTTSSTQPAGGPALLTVGVTPSTASTTPGPAVDCSTTDGGKVAGPDCVTKDLACGDVITSNTRGGVNRFPTRFWEKYTCWPATYSHEGGDERVYRIKRTDQHLHTTVVTLDTPCADLDLMGFEWEGSTCPGLDADIDDCDSQRKAGTRSETIELVADGPTTWMVVVEGVDEEEGAFSLRVECSAYDK